MEVFLIRLLQFILAISLLVLLHEGGHFFFAKLFGVRVEKFYMFFDVGIGKWDGSLFKFKPKNSDTQYGAGWLPLGGYCKIAGMIDESFDKEQMAQPEQPWEFRTKPTWQRLLIMIGGVLVNFLLALFIYSMVMFTWGDSYFTTQDMTMGFKFNDDAKTVQVKRDGKTVSINIPEDMSLLNMLKTEPAFCRPFIPADIDSVMPASPAEKAGIRKGDKILAVNGKPIDSWNEFTYQIGILSDMMATAKTRGDSLKLRTATIVTNRDTIRMVLTEDLKIGVTQTSLASYYKPKEVSYGFFESFPAGIKYGINVLRGYVSDLKYVATADGAKSLGGFGAIGSLFPPTWDWMMFWRMTAFLSIILAFMNILPIPALDGGHVLFLLYEMITGRKPSETFLIRAEYVGFGILILLMVVANLNDILRWLGYM